jgi:hypothetical protein
MGGRTLRSLIIGLLVSGLLAACTPPNEAPSQRLSTQSAQAAKEIVSRVPMNASRIGAEGRQINAEGSIATYNGAPRNFIACVAPPNTDVGDLSLDTRTTVVATGADVISTTIYVVTMARPGATNASITFSNSGRSRFSNGMACQATSKLEATLVGT